MIEIGSLKDFKLFDLLTISNQSKKSGKLTLSLRDNDGFISLDQGNIIDANFKNLSGEEAFYELMFYESGEFKFTEKDQSDLNKTINKSNEELFQESSLRIELTNELRKKSITTDLNSKIKIIYEIDSLILDLVKEGYNTIVSLFKKSNINLNEFVQQIDKLIKDKNIELEKNIQNEIWFSFKRIISLTYNEFTSISGSKMNKDLENKIQDLIKINSLNLDFKDGRIDTKDLFKLDSSEQLSIYKLFLRELKLYISKIYGKDFFNNIFTEVSEVESKMIDL
ncbi:MAG: DUF4388 domain-containing protein [Cyanobacteriota bacterium]